MGPMLAAGEFVSDLGRKGLVLDTKRVGADLYGSLALTGRGYATEKCGSWAGHTSSADLRACGHPVLDFSL
jgi:hypothetical protein